MMRRGLLSLLGSLFAAVVPDSKPKPPRVQHRKRSIGQPRDVAPTPIRKALRAGHDHTRGKQMAPFGSARVGDRVFFARGPRFYEVKKDNTIRRIKDADELRAIGAL
jgi:hypothetical protein